MVVERRQANGTYAVLGTVTASEKMKVQLFSGLEAERVKGSNPVPCIYFLVQQVFCRHSTYRR